MPRLSFDCVNYTAYSCSSFDATVGRPSAALDRISLRSAEQRSHGEPDDPIMKVLISGAGIAGLSLALRLRQRGLVPVVIERSASLRDGGYMLGLSDPGYDAAERMGVVKALEAAQYLPRRLVYLDKEGRRKFTLEGRALDRLIGRRQLNLMRGDIDRALHARVRDDVEIRFGASVETLEAAAGGARVRLDDGATIDGDLIVGADGLHSRVRALHFGPEERFVRFLGSRIAAVIMDRSGFPDLAPDETHSMTEVGRAAGLAATRDGRLMAFFIYRTERARRFETVEAELRHGFAGIGWHVPALLERLPQAGGVYFDEVSQVVAPRWHDGRVVLLGDAGYAVSLIAGRGASLAMAGAYVLAEALANRPADVAAACARYETRLRPMVERAQRMARRNVNLFTPATRLQLLGRDLGLRLAASALIAPLAKRLLNRPGERL
jgi:2-polyprenyl-6-methoxyphenol hydroxylase-like FAD-dependent oxidoreductase